MAWDASQPRPNGKISLPPTDAGMNKVAPTTISPADDKGKMLGDTDEAIDDEKLLERIRKRMQLCVKRESGNRKAALEDRKFKAGDQWPADVAAQRNTDKRPCITIDVTGTLVRQITNPMRENRPGIRFSPNGSKASKEAAKVLASIVRKIEHDCAADIAYDTAADDAVTSGFGYWRYLTEWEAPDSMFQTIVVKRVRNPFTIYLDPYHQEPDGSDSRFAFVTEMVPREDFEEEYPDAMPVPFMEGGAGENLKDWSGKDSVRVAEYFEIKTEKRTLIRLDNGHVGWKDELNDMMAAKVKATPSMVVEERESECPTVKYYKATGVEVLERSDWLGKWIPIVKVIGNEIDIEGDVKLSGVIRAAKDPQRMLNYWETKNTEAVALAPISPWLVEEGQIEGHERQWKNANTKPMPYLSYKATSVSGKPAPPPQRQPFAGVPAGIQQGMENSRQHIQMASGVMLGRLDPAQQTKVNDESGVAMRESRRTSDIGAFHFADNFDRSLRHGGRIMLDLIPKVFDEKRMYAIEREDGEHEMVQFDPHAPVAHAEVVKSQGEPPVQTVNLSLGAYSVTVTTGPNYATKRIEAAASMMQFAKNLPHSAALIADLIAKYQDWDGAEEMATRLAKAVPAQFLTADQKDIPPQVQAMIQNLEANVKQLQGQLQQAMHALNEKGEDRNIAKDKIEKDFMVKLLGVIQKSEDAGAKLELEKVQTLIDLVHKVEGRADEHHNTEQARVDAQAERQDKPEKPKPKQ